MMLLLLLLLCAAYGTSYSLRIGSRRSWSLSVSRPVRHRQPSLLLAKKGTARSSSSARTGQKTVARWSGRNAEEEGEEEGGEEEEEEEGFEYDDKDSNAFKHEYSNAEDNDRNNDDDDDDDDDADDDNYYDDDRRDDRRDYDSDGGDNYSPSESSSQPGTNGFLQWLKTLYEGVFFYGLDEPPPDSDSRGARLKRRALEDMSKGKRKNKSTFFTVSEQVAQSLLAEGPSKERDRTSRRARRSRNAPSRAPPPVVDIDAAAAVAISSSGPEQELALLDAKLALLSRELQLLDRRMQGDADEPSPVTAAARERLLREIEEVQIAYVSLKADGLV